MSQFSTDQYSLSRTFFRRLGVSYTENAGCLFYAVLAVLNFWIFGPFLGSIPFAIGFFARLWASCEREEALAEAFKNAVHQTFEVPIHGMRAEEDREGGYRYDIVVMHPVHGTRCRWRVDGWTYAQLEIGSLVTFVYAPDVPQRYQMVIHRDAPVLPLASCPSPLAPQASSAAHAPFSQQYYQDDPALLVALGVTQDTDVADFLAIIGLLLLTLSPFFLLVAGAGWWCAAIPFVGALLYILLESWVAQWRKSRFARAPKVTASALVQSKHRGEGGSRHFLVLAHPVSGEHITFPVKAWVFDEVQIGQALSFTYLPDQQGQYCVGFE